MKSDGQIIKCPISMHAGRYGKVLESIGNNIYWQPESKADPCMELDDVWRNLNALNDRSVLRALSSLDIPEGDIGHVKEFLQWCADNETGVWFSF